MATFDSITENAQKSMHLLKYIIILLLVFWFGSGFYFVVAPSERGLKMRLGTLDEYVYPEGFHWKLPFIDTVKFADLRIDRADGDATSASKDLQNVETKISVNYQINESSILKLFRTV